MEPIIQNIEDIKESKELYDKSPSKIYIISIFMFLCFLIILFIWLFYGEIDIVSKGTGIIEANENISTIKSKVAGEIKTWNIEEGKYVEKGEVLFEINTENLEVKKIQLEKSIFELKNEINLLNKMIKSIENNKNLFKKEIESEKEYYYKYLNYQEQYNILKLNSKQDLNNINVSNEKNSLNKEYYEKEIENLTNELSELNEYLESIEKKENLFTNKNSNYSIDFSIFMSKISQIEKLISEKQKKYNDMNILFTQGAISKSELDTAKKDFETESKNLELTRNSKILEIKNKIETINSTLAKYKNEDKNLSINDEVNNINHNITETKIKNFETSNIVNIYNEINKKEELINGYNKELETIELGIKNNVIRSPIDGILNLVNNYNVGDFINLDTNICTVVPKDSDIYNVRITIANRDIGKIKLGDDIEYRIDALPYKEYGKFKGKVKFISSNSITYENGKSLYYINGSIENKEIYSYKGVPNELKIGMSANVSIITDRKKIIYYILEKLNIKNN